MIKHFSKIIACLVHKVFPDFEHVGASDTVKEVTFIVYEPCTIDRQAYASEPVDSKSSAKHA